MKRKLSRPDLAASGGIARAFRPPAVLAAGAALVGCAATPPPGDVLADAACPHGGARQERYELYFGATRPDGTPINRDEWMAFLDTEVTPRIPEGLTALEGYGQWQAPDGTVTKQASRVLLIWQEATPETDADLEAIRAAYNAQFDQQSVMRVDGGEDCVSF